jgi:hypothetical protein
MNIWLWLVALVGSLALVALPRVLTWETNQRRKAALRQKAFFNAVEPLLSDNDTPDELIRMLTWMGGKIDDAKMARDLFGKVVRRAKCDNTRPDHVLSAIEALRPELRAKFHEAERHFIVALSYSTRLMGWIWRRAVGMNESAVNMVAVKLESNLPRDPGPGLHVVYAKAA